MHRILLAFAALAFVASPCAAEEAPWLGAELTTVTGTIDKPTPLVGGAIFAVAYVATDSGNLIKIYFSKETVFTDANGKPVEEGMWSTPVKKGEKAEIRYGIIQNDTWKRNGEKGAASVHYLNYVSK